jgi:hypothetical protein
MTSLLNRHDPVVIEFQQHGVTVRSKVFTDAYAARTYYLRKLREGYQPKVVKAPDQNEAL